jgi:hypothetical protein
MARKRPSPFTTEAVEAITSGVAADPKAPTGEWIIRESSIWQSSHPVVVAHPDWFCELGQGQTTPAYWPGRAA